MNQKLPDSPEELDSIVVFDGVEIEPKQRRKNRIYVRELIDGLLEELPNHGIIVIVREDEPECEE